MPHVFGPKFLRVRTPKTSDGKTLEYEKGQPVYTETNLPLTARKALERENERTAEPYRHIIEEIDENAEPKRLVKGAGSKREQLLAELAALDDDHEDQTKVDSSPKEVAAPKLKPMAVTAEKAKKVKPVVNHAADSLV